MACFHVTKHGFTEIGSMIDDIVAVMTGDVANQIGPVTNNIPYFTLEFSGVSPTFADNSNVKILSSTINCDPLANSQVVGQHISNVDPGWRICFNILDSIMLAVHAGTSLQLSNTGEIARLNDRIPRSLANTATGLGEPAGNLGSDWVGNAVPATENLTNVWLNRTPSRGSEEAYPMSYALTLTNRGIFLGVWEDSQEEIPQGIFDPVEHPNPDLNSGNSPFRWLLIQRSVDRTNGHVRGGAKLRQDPSVLAETSRCPVFCVTGAGNINTYRKFIVREADVVSPSRKKFAAVDTPDSPAMLNPWPQQSLTETGEFVVTFINNLTTPRYRYPDELDMLGTVSAEVIGAGTSIRVNVYGEPYPREYTAVYANERHGQGMRIMVLTKMGVDPATGQDTYNEAVENSHVNYP